jgi:hypothetical protein
MPYYRVLINDNAHFMDESERTDHGVFADADEAISDAMCQKATKSILRVSCPCFDALASGRP